MLSAGWLARRNWDASVKTGGQSEPSHSGSSTAISVTTHVPRKTQGIPCSLCELWPLGSSRHDAWSRPRGHGATMQGEQPPDPGQYQGESRERLQLGKLLG